MTSGKWISDKWIRVEDRMPEEFPSMFSQFKGTVRWREGLMYSTISKEVLVTVKFPNGNTFVSIERSKDGEFKTTGVARIGNCEVIAWMELPEPYVEEVKEVEEGETVEAGNEK